MASNAAQCSRIVGRKSGFTLAKNYEPRTWKALAVFVVAACLAIYGQSSPKQMAGPAVAALGSGFVSDTAQVDGATLHCVRGGAGPAIILLHGFPEDWYAYHRAMQLLARQFTVDLRGLGGSIPMVRLKQVSLLFLLAFAICQCVPVRHPPLQQLADGGATRRLNLNNPNIEAILNRSCGDCHSSHASLPWYGRIAPVSWLVASHIEKGIHKWDLSVWESRKPLRGELEDICDAVTDRSMPLRSYTWIHPKAKLADRDIATLCGLAESSSSTDKSTR